jgi:hypothetical protein
MSLLGRGARGLVAGKIGTAAFDVWLFARYRQGGGDSGFVDWETSAGLTSWDGAPAPALLGKRLFVSGNVATAERRAAVVTVAERLAPGYEVHNETVVPSRVEVDQKEELS